MVIWWWYDGDQTPAWTIGGCGCLTGDAIGDRWQPGVQAGNPQLDGFQRSRAIVGRCGVSTDPLQCQEHLQKLQTSAGTKVPHLDQPMFLFDVPMPIWGWCGSFWLFQKLGHSWSPKFRELRLESPDLQNERLGLAPFRRPCRGKMGVASVTKTSSRRYPLLNIQKAIENCNL